MRLGFCNVLGAKVTGGTDTKRALFLVMAVFLAIGSVVFFLQSNSGEAEATGSNLLESHVVGLPVGLKAPSSLRGVTGAPFPWHTSHGEVKLSFGGRLELEVEGHLISEGGPTGTTGPVTQVFASLTCEGAGVVDSTADVPLSPAGDAKIDETITLPDTCVGPIVLLRAGGALPGLWNAASGFELSH